MKVKRRGAKPFMKSTPGHAVKWAFIDANPKIFTGLSCAVKQTSANQGLDPTLVNKANSARSSPKAMQRQVINLMDQTRVTRPRGEH